MERRAYYNALRVNQYKDPSLAVEDWQICDYRKLSLATLFIMLSDFDLYLDRNSFLSFAEECETPEELTNTVIGDSAVNEETMDRIYLLVFELWRRLLPEKRCLSIFCDEIDHQIFAYNSHELDNPEPLENMIANLKQVLEDNADLGEEPAELFATIEENCANDIEGFLYDFIAEKIDHANHTYASELIDDFSDVAQDPKWFDLLKARLVAENDPAEAQEILSSLVKKTASEKDIDFNFEVLFFLVQEGDQNLFLKVIKNTFPILETEQDFQDLLYLCADFFQYLDKDNQEKEIHSILAERSQTLPENAFDLADPGIKNLKKILRV